MRILRTNFENKDFTKLVIELDKELKVRDGDDHEFYNQFNSIDNMQYALVLYVDDIAVGCGALKPLNNTQAEVKRVFIDEKHRGNKLAGNIMNDLEKWAKELGHSTCILETGFNQPEAIRLYEKCNYHKIENYGQYTGIETSICFEKEL